MAKLEHGRFYRFPDGTVAQAEAAGDGWVQLTDVADVQGHPGSSERWHTWGVSPTGALHEGPVVSLVDGGTHAGVPLSFHTDELEEVVPSGMDYPAADAGAWTPAALVRGPQDHTGLPAGFDDGYPGFDDGEPPAFDAPAWAQASPLPPRPQQVDPGMITIRYNNTQVAEPCATCGEIVDQPVGPALLTIHGMQVCRACGETYAPELTAMLTAWEKTQE